MQETLTYIKIDDIAVNPYQPRIEFKTEELEELAASIKENGLIQPIIVRPSSIIGYELVAGERRWRASKMIGMETIPAIIKDLTDQESMHFAIIENLQRSDLNPIEEARAYAKLLEKNQMTHEELAQFMGKSRPYITNCLRLLKLPDSIIQGVEKKEITQGHARILLTLDNEEEQIIWFQKLIAHTMSIRKFERAIKSDQNKKGKKKKDIFVEHIERSLSKSLGLPVSLTYSNQRRKKGELHLYFHSEEDLNRIINKLK